MIETEHAPAPYRPDQAPWGWREIAIVVFLTMVALVAVFTVLAFLLNVLGIDSDEAETDAVASVALLLGQMVLDFAAVGVAAAFSLRKYGLRPSAWGLVRPPKLNIGLILLTLVLCFVALGVYRGVTVALGLEDLEPQSNVPTELFEHPAVVPLTLFLILAVAPFAEEMFFRGFIFHGMWSRIGFWPAAIGSGFFFSLIHVSSSDLIGLIVPFTIIGALLAWIVKRTGSLWNAIAVHFLFNAVGVTANLAQVILR
ncbi:MAG: lysostaphin resistance A-like protein [Dehalococcoidia bacterium]